MKSYLFDFDNVIPIIFFVFFLASVASLQYCVRRNTRPDKGYFWLLPINIAVFCSLFFLFCLGGELYFHFCYDSSDSFSITKTGDDWFRKHFNSNSWGFRDNVDYVQQIIPGKRRITFIGDSFTAGQGIANVEDRFANRIRSIRPGWDIHVLSECGSDSIDELSLVKELISDQYQFDKVVLVYNLNDISKLMPVWNTIINKLYSHKIYSQQASFLLSHSYLLNTLYYRAIRTYNPDLLSYDKFVLSAYDDREIWGTQKATLIAIKHDVEARGGKLLVVTFPFLHSLGNEYKFRGVHRQMAEFWKEQGVPNLDLLEVFESHRSDKLIVNKYDTHPNERSHALAAEAIMVFLDSCIM